VSLRKFFTITTVLILFLAAGLFSTGLGRLQALGVLPMMEPLWDTSSILSDRSIVGSFLSGLVGYRARPSLLEVGGYLAYLIGASLLLFRTSAKPMPAPASAGRQPAARRSR
jgi:high-affinity iron transporter